MTKQGRVGSVRAMDNNPQPTAKQNAIEALRSSESIVVTTSKNPSRDEIAAAIGLHLLLGKLDKVAEVVVTKDIPKELSFLPNSFINKQIQGQRDFIIEIDQSRTEADRLKYLTEDGKLKVYITPYNGLYSKDDVSFEYGEYHCDAIVALGAANTNDLDESINKDSKLTQNAKFIFLASEGEGGGATSWVDTSASSVCEMVMSMSEALGSGMMDRDIATALFTGIVDKTEHFTNTATSPKVMTMAAQLLAAGANQAEVVNRLRQESASNSLPPEVAQQAANIEQQQEPAKPDKPDNEFQIRKSKSEKTDAQPAPATPEPAPASTPTPTPAPASPASTPTPAPAPATPAPAPVSGPEVQVGPNGEVNLHHENSSSSAESNKPPQEDKQPSQQPAFTGTIGAPVSQAPQAPKAPKPAPQQPAKSETSPQTQQKQQQATPPQNNAPQTPAKPAASSAPNQAGSHDSDSFAMPRERVVQPPGESSGGSSNDNAQNEPQPQPQQPPPSASSASDSSDLEAARRAVEEAHQSSQPPQPPQS